jgi:hypothetical protein
MSELNELITKATQTANLLVSDLEQAYCEVRTILRPEGPTLSDKALLAYLAERLAAARKLESDLLNLS